MSDLKIIKGGQTGTGILIEHEEIAALEKKHYNILWRNSLPYK